MFNPSVSDVRNFFFNTYSKLSSQHELTALEKITASVIMEHPEYNSILGNPDKFLTYEWLPESGETNPFLHMSMHLSILEQISIDQPKGILELYRELCSKFSDEHESQHQIMDCLAEMIWQAQSNNSEPEPKIYLECLRNKLGKGK